MTTTIPVPHTEQHRNSYDGKLSRTIDTTYTLPTDDPDIRHELTISTSYNTDRRRYVGSVTRCKVETERQSYGTFEVRHYGLFEGGPVPSTVIEYNVARYSVKRLRELHELWLASVKEYDMAELIEWAEAAK